MKLTTISIGIPVFNQAQTIANTIESVLNQIKQPFEVVVSENHSTDGTKEIVESFSDRVRIVRPDIHLSMSENWDFCVNSCNGEWIGLISGDDMLLPNYVESMQKGILINLDAVFVMGGWKIINTIKNTSTDKYLLSMSKITFPPKTTKMLLAGPKASFASFCFKKESYTEVKGYDKNFQFIQDWILQFDLSFKGNFVKIDDLVAKYYQNERPGLEILRMPIYINDFLLYLNSKIWTAKNAGVSEGEIIKNGKKVMVSLLNRITAESYTCNESELERIEEVCKKFDSLQTYEKWNINKNVLIHTDNYLKRVIISLLKKVIMFFKQL
jgi:glycosyltransferase involved in cell wall biosynthesis